MTELENALRVAFVTSTADLPPSSASASVAWRRGRQQRHTRLLAGAGAGALVISGGAATVLGESARSSQRETLSPAAAGSLPASADPTCVPAEQPAARFADTRIDAVCLPDPAPGYPLRIVTSAGINEGARIVNGKNEGGDTADGLSHPEASFVLARLPETVVTYPDGLINQTPAGPEVRLRVGTPGDFAVTPTDGRIDGQQVTGMTTVAGRPAYVTGGTTPTTLWYSVDGLVVTVEGTDTHQTPAQVMAGQAAPGPVVPVSDLVAVAESLHIPASAGR